MLVSSSKIVRSAVGSLITGLQTMPSIAWFPLAILLFGLSEQAILFVVVLGAAPSIANGLITGVDHVPPVLLRAGHMMGATGISRFRHVVLPASMPSFVGGLKQGWAFAWRSLMAGELIVVLGASVGFLLQQYRNLADAPGLIAMMIVILVVGIVVDAVLFGVARPVGAPPPRTPRRLTEPPACGSLPRWGPNRSATRASSPTARGGCCSNPGRATSSSRRPRSAVPRSLRCCARSCCSTAPSSPAGWTICRRGWTSEPGATKRCSTQLEAQTHRRFIKTHTPLDGIPEWPDVTYVAVARDPRDVFVSWEHHVANIDVDHLFSAIDGAVGMDTVLPFIGASPETVEERFELWLVDDDQMGRMSLALVAGHIEASWDRRDRPNVELFHFEEMRTDRVAAMTRLAAAFGLERSTARIEELAERRRSIGCASEPTTSHRTPSRSSPISSRFFRSGEGGDWRIVRHARAGRRLLAAHRRAHVARAARLAAPRRWLTFTWCLAPACTSPGWKR